MNEFNEEKNPTSRFLDIQIFMQIWYPVFCKICIFDYVIEIMTKKYIITVSNMSN